MIANATGCSSIWAASSPSMHIPQMRSAEELAGKLLFEDNAEFGYGMYLELSSAEGKADKAYGTGAK